MSKYLASKVYLLLFKIFTFEMAESVSLYTKYYVYSQMYNLFQTIHGLLTVSFIVCKKEPYFRCSVLAKPFDDDLKII